MLKSELGLVFRLDGLRCYYLSRCNSKDAPSEECQVVPRVEAMPQGRQPIDSYRAELGTPAVVGHIAEPCVCVLIPTGHCSAEVLREL